MQSAPKSLIKIVNKLRRFSSFLCARLLALGVVDKSLYLFYYLSM